MVAKNTKWGRLKNHTMFGNKSINRVLKMTRPTKLSSKQSLQNMEAAFTCRRSSMLHKKFQIARSSLHHIYKQPRWISSSLTRSCKQYLAQANCSSIHSSNRLSSISTLNRGLSPSLIELTCSWAATKLYLIFAATCFYLVHSMDYKMNLEARKLKDSSTYRLREPVEVKVLKTILHNLFQVIKCLCLQVWSLWYKMHQFL